MDALLLIMPAASEAAAVPQPVYTSGTQTSTEWNGTWQNARVKNGDAAAWALVVFFLVTLGLVAGCVAAALTRPRGPRREHLLIDEVLRDEDKLAASTPGFTEGGAPWEKSADWWREENG
jgi:hypothetical protein